MESALTSHGSSKSNKKPSDGRGISDYQLPCYWRIVTVEHVLPPKNAVFLMGSNPGPLAMEATALPTELKEISTKTVSRGGYEPIKYTTVPMTLCSGAFPLHSPPHLKSHHTFMTKSQIPTFNSTSFLVLTMMDYLVGCQYNSRACFTSEKCNVPDWIQSVDLSHCKLLFYQLS
jgi:hypothetical protein